MSATSTAEYPLELTSMATEKKLWDEVKDMLTGVFEKAGNAKGSGGGDPEDPDDDKNKKNESDQPKIKNLT